MASTLFGMDNSIGSLRIYSRQFNKPSLQVGTEYGDVFGVSYWGLSKFNFLNNGKGSIYLRDHHTSGNYSFYDDNLTPFNTSDDDENAKERIMHQSPFLLCLFSSIHIKILK